MDAKHFPISCLWLTLTGPALAQSFATFPIESRRMPYPTDSGISAACAAGDFDGNRIIDAVQVRSGTLTFIHDVGFDGVAVDVSFACSDVCTLANGYDNHDVWLSVGATGLHVGRWSDDAYAATGVAQDGCVIQPIDTVAWCGVNRVTTGDIDGDGRLDIVGCDPNAHLVRTYLGSATGFVPGPSIVVSTGPFAIGTFDRTNAHRDQVVVSLQDGAHVFSLVGSSYQELPCGLPKLVYSQFARYLRTDGTNSILALTRATAAGQCVVLDKLGGVDSTIQLAVGVDATGLAVADFERDGRVDFAVNSRASGSHLWSIAGATTPTFNLGIPQMNAFLAPADGLGASDPTRETRCVAIDIDNDTDSDILFGDDNTMSASALVNPALDANAFKPYLIHFSSPEFIEDEGLTQLEIGLDILPPALLLPGLTHYEATVWRQPSPSEPADPIAVAYAIEAIANPQLFDVITIQLPENTPSFSTIYWLRLRAVGVSYPAVASSPQLTAAGPCASFQIDLSATLKAYFANPGGPNGTPILSGGSIPQPPPGSVVFPGGPPSGGHSSGGTGGSGN